MIKDNNKKTRIVVTGKGGGGQAESVEWDDILNKPEFATVATSGDYDDLTDKPTILTQWFGTQAEYDAIETKDPNVVYNIEGSDNVQSDWNQTDTTADDYIKNKPTIPAAQVNSDWNSNSGVSQILNKPTLATVATSGSYNDLSDKPEIPSVPAMATQELTFTLEGGTKKTIEFYTVPNYFYVEDISGSANTLSITNTSNDVYCSTDRANWTLFNGTATIPANSKLYLKANINSWEGRRISASGNHNIGGNIMSLLYVDNFENQTSFPSGSNGNFAGLFVDNTHLISAVNLIFPATTLTDRCYNYMFGKCSSLTTAPTILPATTVTYSCYGGMFEDCSSLTTAPVLPATTLATRCYEVMFKNCTSLTQAPALPARTLDDYCYRIMFIGCTNINTITTYATDITADNCLIDWLDGVSSTGDFYNLGGATYPSGASGIPTGWTEHTSL